MLKKVKVQQKEYELEEKDALLIITLQELIKEIKKLV